MSVGPSTSGFGFALCKAKCTDETSDVFAVAVWRLVSDERDLNVDRARLRLEGNLQLQAVEQRPELWLGQVLKTLGEKRQAVKRGGEIRDGRRGVGRLGGERVRAIFRMRMDSLLGEISG